MSEVAPKAELMRALGRLIRGLSALFWGLPTALVLGVQTARTEWLKTFGFLPMMTSALLIYYGLLQLEHFMPQERIWRRALDRCKIFALVNIGLSPFVFWWHQVKGDLLFMSMVVLLILSAVCFLFFLNQMLIRLTAMLPDETMRQETRLFSRVNQGILFMTVLLVSAYLIVIYVPFMPRVFFLLLLLAEYGRVAAVIVLVLLPLSITMAMLWKIKEVVLAGVLSHES